MMRTSELAPRIEGLTAAKVKINTKRRFLYYLPGGNIMYYLPGGKFQSWAPLSQEGGGTVATKGRFPGQEIL